MNEIAQSEGGGGMIEEINQVKRFLAEAHGLPIEGEGATCRVVGEVPDGEHVIPLGKHKTMFQVSIREGRIYIGEQVTTPTPDAKQTARKWLYEHKGFFLEEIEEPLARLFDEFAAIRVSEYIGEHDRPGGEE